MPLVVIEPPLIAVVPVPLLRLAAANVLVIVVVPVVVNVTAPKAVPLPTASVKVTPPVPLEIPRVLAEEFAKVEPNETKLLVVVKVVLAPRVTAPL